MNGLRLVLLGASIVGGWLSWVADQPTTVGYPTSTVIGCCVAFGFIILLGRLIGALAGICCIGLIGVNLLNWSIYWLKGSNDSPQFLSDQLWLYSAILAGVCLAGYGLGLSGDFAPSIGTATELPPPPTIHLPPPAIVERAKPRCRYCGSEQIPGVCQYSPHKVHEAI